VSRPLIPNERIALFFEMERKYEERDVNFFAQLLTHQDFVIRARAVCILAELAGREHIKDIAEVLLNDDNPIVRHEAAYSLGQLGRREAIPYLIQALQVDPHPIVRHEAAIALGVIGRQEAEPALSEALSDPSPEVVDSCLIALSNIEFCKQLFDEAASFTAKKFARLTGG
jgi:HEAT repeat protein